MVCTVTAECVLAKHTFRGSIRHNSENQTGTSWGVGAYHWGQAVRDDVLVYSRFLVLRQESLQTAASMSGDSVSSPAREEDCRVNTSSCGEEPARVPLLTVTFIQALIAGK